MTAFRLHHTFLLPGGYVDEQGVLQREVDLTPLTGREEELLAEPQASASPALVTALLSHCVRRLGVLSPVPASIIRRLLIADRQYLLLKLREATVGEQVQATVQCPWAECGKKVDIDFSLADIPVQESQDKGPLYTLELSPEAAVRSESGELYREIIFRLPCGEDQEQLAPLLDQNDAGTLALLLGRCIRRIGPVSDPGPELIHRLPPLARLEIERQMETVSPQVNLTLDTNCPECGREFVLPFDLAEFVFTELQTSREALYREVHCLAYHYHWSEHEIMSLPRTKRRHYITLLAEEMERLSHAS